MPDRAQTNRASSPLPWAVGIVHQVCCLAGSLDLLNEVRRDARSRRIEGAIVRHDTPRLFDWLFSAFSFQGISDRVARGYIRDHGSVTWRQIEEAFASKPHCPRLRSYWAHDHCGYDKGSGCCSEPEYTGTCPLPRHNLRNGRLNQTAYSLFLFVRDIAGGDIVGWIDRQLSELTETTPSPAHVLEAQESLVGPLRHVFGISDKQQFSKSKNGRYMEMLFLRKEQQHDIKRLYLRKNKS